jgi:hypothetical protein
MGLIGLIVVVLAVGAIQPLRTAIIWATDWTERVYQMVLPGQEQLETARAVFSTNFSQQSLLSEATHDVVVRGTSAEIITGLFGWSRSSQTIDYAVAQVRAVVSPDGVVIDEEMGRVVIHLQSAKVNGIYVALDNLPIPQYAANLGARLGDLLNGVESPQTVVDQFRESAVKEAQVQQPRLLENAEAAATQTLEELMSGEGITVEVIFDR